MENIHVSKFSDWINFRTTCAHDMCYILLIL